jgi:hypothetical protein
MTLAHQEQEKRLGRVRGQNVAVETEPSLPPTLDDVRDVNALGAGVQAGKKLVGFSNQVLRCHWVLKSSACISTDPEVGAQQ